MRLKALDSPHMLYHALNYARRGLRVFPIYEPVMGACSCGNPNCSSPAKHPRNAHGSSDATTDPAIIMEWWNQWPNASIAIEARDLMVFDADPGKGGNETLASLQKELGPLPDTWHVFTGGGGDHLFYKRNGTPAKNGTDLRPGFDLRTDGGYVVASPSRHISGKRYQWDADCARELADLPKAWLDFISERGQPKSKTSGVSNTIPSPPEVIERARRYIAKEPPAIAGKGGHNQTYHVACILIIDFGLTSEEGLKLLSEYNLRCKPQWTEKDLVHKIEDAEKAPAIRGKLRNAALVEEKPPHPAGECSEQQSEQERTARELPIVDAADSDLDRATRAAWNALRQANTPAYMFRHGVPSRIEPDETGAPILRELTLDRIRFELARCASYQVKKDAGYKPAHPPIAVCKNILATLNPPLPVLTRIVEAPVFAPDGSLQLKPGYHPASLTYYA
ncbi:MAG: hypothetical protein H6Q04_1770, partial [Acidobacteria bacterium]|nr:hypothetical protein [Acidobacteriota bacterium]